MLLLGLLALLISFFHLHPTPPRRDLLILLLPPLVILVAVSSKTGFSDHFRYVLPIFPFAFIRLGDFCLSARTSMKNKGPLEDPTVTHGGNRGESLKKKQEFSCPPPEM